MLTEPLKAKQRFRRKPFFNPDGHLPPLGVVSVVSLERQTMTQLDQIDQSYLDNAAALRVQIQGPGIGDYVLFPTGELERFSHDWGDGIQTSPGGSFYLLANGRASFSSGGLNPTVPADSIEELPGVTLMGRFWFFHHARAGAGRGVYVDCVCRVFKTTSSYKGFLGKDFQNPHFADLKAQIKAQLEAQLAA